jgi:uncharacterized membrane protein YeaQ/YmgE (transglycosylase-associated protein family)
MEHDAALAAREEPRVARRRVIEELRASPAPSPFKIALYGLAAGAAAAAVIGLLYLLVFGVVGSLLARWRGDEVLTGYPGPLFPQFIGALFFNAIWGAVVAVQYHLLCHFFRRAASPMGGIGSVLVVSVVVTLVIQLGGYSAPLRLSIAARVFGYVGSLVWALIVGAVVGQAELFERKPSGPLGSAKHPSPRHPL